MSFNTYPLGSLVRVGATVHRVTDSAEVTATAALEVVDPDGEVTTPEVTHDEEHTSTEPAYYADIDANKAGTWRYRFAFTGTAQAAEKGSFIVETGITS